MKVRHLKVFLSILNLQLPSITHKEYETTSILGILFY